MAQKKGNKSKPHTEHFLGIPISLSDDIPMKVNTHDLYIVVTADCKWCYSDNDRCFPPKKFLKAGLKRKGRVYGPFTPVKKGIVRINAVPNSLGDRVPCDPAEIGPLGGHTITVGGP